MTMLPVIGVPVKGSSLGRVDSLHNIVQMPVSLYVLYHVSLLMSSHLGSVRSQWQRWRSTTKQMRDCLWCTIHNLLKRPQVTIGWSLSAKELLARRHYRGPFTRRQYFRFHPPPPSKSQLRATGLEPSTTGYHNGWRLLGANMHALPLQNPRTGGSHHS
jgi:hypothetical protein